MTAASKHSTRRHAVVIGGSMAGMLAARVLADHFDRVTLLERDPCPSGPRARPGLAQARHIHVLLEAGRRVLDRLFPSLMPKLIEAGAEQYDGVADFEWISPAGLNPRFPSTIRMLGATRDFIDWGIREQLQEHDGVSIQTASATGLLLDASKSRVVGVTSSPPGQTTQDLAADFVVDATGRRSRLPQWLHAHGYPRPREIVVNGFLGYASRLVHLADVPRDWKTFYIQCAPPVRKRGGVIASVENGKGIVTLIGGGKDYPPIDESEFFEFARSLPDQRFAETYAAADPLTPISGSRSTENRLRLYESLGRRPDGLVVLGDAVCAFNPVYGQGMSAAAQGAEILDVCLRRYLPNQLGRLGSQFQTRLAKANARPWLLATSEDYRYREVEGAALPLSSRLSHRYLDRVSELALHVPFVHLTMVEVLHLIRPPSSLFSPRILARVLLSCANRRAVNHTVASRSSCD